MSTFTLHYTTKGLVSGRGYPVMPGQCPKDGNTLLEIIQQQMPRAALVQATCYCCGDTFSLARHNFEDGNPACEYRPNGGGK
jgi:hypothetical protein